MLCFFAKSAAATAPAPATGFAEGAAPMIWSGRTAKLPLGDHPLFGCMAGTLRVEVGFDLTAPLYGDTDIDGWMNEKANQLRAVPL